MPRNIGISRQISNNNLEKTVLKTFSETSVIVVSRNVEAFHCPNQPANPKKTITGLSKRKDVANIINNNKKIKSVKPQNISLPSSCNKEILCKYYRHLWWKCKFLQIRGYIQWFWLINTSIRIRHQNDEVRSVTQIEDQEHRFLKDDL